MRLSAPALLPEAAFAAGHRAPARGHAGSIGAAERIAILFHDFAAGGSERIMIRLANAWAAQGRRVEIVCGSALGPSRALVNATVRITEMRPAIPRGVGSRVRLGRAMRALLPRLDCDVLVAPGNFHLLALWAMGRAPVPVVCKLSNPLAARGIGGTPAGVLARLACRHVDAVAAMSPALAREAEAALPGRLIPVLPQPNLGDRAVLPAPRAPRGPLHLLAAGRAVRQKRFDLAIDVLARLPADSRLTIAGDGPGRRRLEQRARRLGLADRVRFAGHVPDLAPLMAETDIFLLTSSFEGFPGVVVEALAAGIPVVATDASPALSELLAHPSFGRVTASDADALAEAILSLAEAGEAPDAAAREALLAPLRTAHAATRWLDFLDQVVEERQPAAGMRLVA